MRFEQEEKVAQIIEDAIFSALSTKDSIVRMADNVKVNNRNQVDSKIYEKQNEIDIKKLLSTNEENLKIEEELTQYFENEKSSFINKEEEVDLSITIKESSTKPFDFSDLRYIGTIFNTYILAQDSDAFYIFDQHACHERINYEKFINQYNSESKFKQPIMFPILLNTTFDAGIDDNWVQILDNIGFTVQEFGINSFRITEIPTFMTLKEGEDFLNDFIDNLKEDIYISNTVVIDKLIMKSCKASIKANDKINMDEIKGLMNQLSKCVNPFSCPHGRPTFVKMTKYEIEKIFKRV